MMLFIVCCISFHVVLVSGSSLSDQVFQTPAYIHKEPGQTAQINCSHSIQNYDQILWYKKLENRQLQLLGYLYLSRSNLEAGVNVKIEGSADKDQTYTLTVEELSLSSSAVYFCAARYHSTTDD